jgi:hypothetical protein
LQPLGGRGVQEGDGDAVVNDLPAAATSSRRHGKEAVGDDD